MDLSSGGEDHSGSAPAPAQIGADATHSLAYDHHHDFVPPEVILFDEANTSTVLYEPEQPQDADQSTFDGSGAAGAGVGEEQPSTSIERGNDKRSSVPSKVDRVASASHSLESTPRSSILSPSPLSTSSSDVPHQSHWTTLHVSQSHPLHPHFLGADTSSHGDIRSLHSSRMDTQPHSSHRGDSDATGRDNNDAEPEVTLRHADDGLLHPLRRSLSQESTLTVPEDTHIDLPLSARLSLHRESLTTEYGEQFAGEYRDAIPTHPQEPGAKPKKATPPGATDEQWNLWAFFDRHSTRIGQFLFLVVVVFFAVMIGLLVSELVPVFALFDSHVTTDVTLVNVTMGSAVDLSSIPFTATLSFPNYNGQDVAGQVRSSCLYVSPGVSGDASTAVLCAKTEWFSVAAVMPIDGFISVTDASLLSTLISQYATYGWLEGYTLSVFTVVTLKSRFAFGVAVSRSFTEPVTWGTASDGSDASSDTLEEFTLGNPQPNAQSYAAVVSRFGSNARGGLAIGLPNNTFSVVMAAQQTPLLQGALVIGARYARTRRKRAIAVDVPVEKEVAVGSFDSIVLSKSSGYTVRLSGLSTRGKHAAALQEVAALLVGGNTVSLRVVANGGYIGPGLESAILRQLSFPFVTCARLPTLIAFNGACSAAALDADVGTGNIVDSYSMRILGVEVHRIQLAANSTLAAFNLAHPNPSYRNLSADANTLLAWTTYWAGTIASARASSLPLGVDVSAVNASLSTAEQQTIAPAVILDVFSSGSSNGSVAAAWVRAAIVDAASFSDSIAPCIIAGGTLDMLLRVRMGDLGTLLHDALSDATVRVSIPSSFGGIFGESSLGMLLLASGGIEDTQDTFKMSGKVTRFSGDVVTFGGVPLFSEVPITGSVMCPGDGAPCGRLSVRWDGIAQLTSPLSVGSVVPIYAHDPASVYSTLAFMRNSTATTADSNATLSRPDALDALASDVLLARDGRSVRVALQLSTCRIEYNHSIPAVARKPLVSAMRVALSTSKQVVLRRSAVAHMLSTASAVRESDDWADAIVDTLGGASIAGDDARVSTTRKRAIAVASVSIALTNPLPFDLALLSVRATVVTSSTSVNADNTTISMECSMSGQGDLGSPSARPVLSHRSPPLWIPAELSVDSSGNGTSTSCPARDANVVALTGTVHVSTARQGGFDAWVAYDGSDLLAVVSSR